MWERSTQVPENLLQIQSTHPHKKNDKTNIEEQNNQQLKKSSAVQTSKYPKEKTLKTQNLLEVSRLSIYNCFSSTNLPSYSLSTCQMKFNIEQPTEVPHNIIVQYISLKHRNN